MTGVDPLAFRRAMGRAQWSVPRPLSGTAGDEAWGLVHRSGDGSAIVSVGPVEGEMWRHASMTRRGRTPSYEDLVLLHQAAFGDNWAYQVFAPTTAHVNLNDNCLHLWGRVDGSPALPNFGAEGTI